MSKPKKSKRSIFRRIGFAVLILYIGFTLVDMQINLADKSDNLVQLQQQLEVQRIENKDIQRQLAGSFDEEEIERIAREQLKYVSPNEKVYIDISGS